MATTIPEGVKKLTQTIDEMLEAAGQKVIEAQAEQTRFIAAKRALLAAPEPEKSVARTKTIKEAFAKPKRIKDRGPTHVVTMILDMARERPGHPAEMLTKMVGEKRKAPASALWRITKAIDEMVADGRLHRAPDGALSVGRIQD